ncbi:MAG: hypothetical protein IPF98_23030 [Gemmatimonadetes bacterium]|nr:hypothetical protein [Gemmatimonadota bacterium]MCC6770583.1 hypothetical protein [Gemmatimonadaceae bacterium]
MRWIRSWSILAMLGTAAPAVGGAQTRPISLWLGAGRPVAQDSVSFALRNLDAYGAIQLDLPILPVALRADVSFAGSGIAGGRRNVTTSAILPLRLPVVQPYAMLGYGTTDWGKSSERRGISYGAGVRLQLGGFGAFGQARRYQRVDRTIGTIGLVF